MTLYVIRHGESIWNSTQQIQGRADIPLSQRGLEQAYEMALSCKNRAYSFIGASPLIRAQQTASVIAKELKIPIQTFSELKARSYGPWEGKTIPEIRQEYKSLFQLMKEWTLSDIFSRSPLAEIESYHEVSKRALKLFRRLAKTGENILLVTHSGVISAILLSLRYPSTEVPLMGHKGHVEISSTDKGFQIKHIEGLLDTKKFESQGNERTIIF